MNTLLVPLYQEIYGENFDYSSFENRLQMQKMIYLLQKEGLNVGGYQFFWYKHGPYSQVLLNDMFLVNQNDRRTLNLTANARHKIDSVKELLMGGTAKYSKSNWAECVASLYYLFEESCGLQSDEKIVETLMKKKKHLNDVVENNHALELVKDMYNKYG